jgi:hypothetical protein
VKTEPTLSFGTPVQLFALEFKNTIDTMRNWDVSPDGRFLVVVRASGERLSDHIEVSQHAFDSAH